MKVRFGKDGPLVTRLGFGGIPIQTIPYEDAVEVVRYAYERGIRLFDTARGYTTSERIIGEALAGVREDVFIATKSGAKTVEKISEHFQQSLDNLGTDYVDLFMFHNIMTEDDLHKILAPGGPFDYMKQQQKLGRARIVGFSSHSVETSVLAVGKRVFASVQFPFNYLETQCVKRLLPDALEAGMGFMVMKPFAGGALSSASAALKWVCSQNISTVIPGMMSKHEIDTAVESALLVEAELGQVEPSTDVQLIEPPLTDEERLAMRQDITELSQNFCRRCQYCLPCPNGIPVNFIVSGELFFKRAGWHRADQAQVERIKKGLECVECGVCEARCPYLLPLSTMVRPMAERLLDKISQLKQASTE